MIGCGTDDPKNLAKQTFDLGQEALALLLNPAKAAEVQKKAEDIEKKVAKLSAGDRAVYEQELARLDGQGLGALFDAASTLDAASVQDALNTAGQAADTAQKAIDLLNTLGGGK
jgi:curved DNA-binding protein CbpA